MAFRFFREAFGIVAEDFLVRCLYIILYYHIWNTDHAHAPSDCYVRPPPEGDIQPWRKWLFVLFIRWRCFYHQNCSKEGSTLSAKTAAWILSGEWVWLQGSECNIHYYLSIVVRTCLDTSPVISPILLTPIPMACTLYRTNLALLIMIANHLLCEMSSILTKANAIYKCQ